MFHLENTCVLRVINKLFCFIICIEKGSKISKLVAQQGYGVGQPRKSYRTYITQYTHMGLKFSGP